MQRPRRTSEFQEEPGTANKRQPRQSRRPPSLERTSIAGSAVRPSAIPTSVLRGRGVATPQRTPLRSSSAKKALFTAEKQRLDQTLRILNYLSNANVHPDILGKIYETGDLRQMTIKQFVTIMNYLLKFVAGGNKFTVNATNHVEDICDIMRKLKYHHQIMKSWLKTPTAQNAIGHVVTLLDFLLDFAPKIPLDDSDYDIYNDLPDTELNQLQSAKSDEIQIPDDDFHKLMLRHAEEGFPLWDRQKMDRYAELQQSTADVFIQKRSGFSGCIGLDAEIVHMQQKLQRAVSKTVPVSKTDEEICIKLQNEKDEISEKIMQLKVAVDEGARQINDLNMQIMEDAVKIASIQKENNHLKKCAENQSCSATQRNTIVEEIGQLKHVCHCKSRTVNSWKEKNHNKQVLLSRIKKNLTNTVGAFNIQLRELSTALKESSLSSISSLNQINLDDHQLPLNAIKNMDMQSLIPVLEMINETVRQKTQEYSDQQQILARQNDDIAHDIEAILCPKLKDREIELSECQTNLNTFTQKSKIKRNQHIERLQKLQKEVSVQELEIKNWSEIVQQKQWELKSIEEDNDETISNMEKEHNERCKVRAKYLNDYDIVLCQLEQKTAILHEIVKNSSSQRVKE